MLVSTAQYAKHLHKSQHQVVYMCQTGKIPATRVGKCWKINVEQADLALQKAEQAKVEEQIEKYRPKPKKRRPCGSFMNTLKKMLEDCVYGI